MTYNSNIVAFPNAPVVSRKVSGALTKTVYPIKEISQIQALHHYLLAKAKDAPTPSKKRNAWRNWFFFALGINLGFRGGDITELTWGRLVVYNEDDQTYTIRRDEQNFIHAEKTGKATFVIINPEAERYIHLYLKAVYPLGIRPYYDAPVFPSTKTAGTSEAVVPGHIDCDNIGRIIKKAAKEVGITQSICTHSLRKTFGYHYYKATGDIITLQKIFGHSSPAVTLTYIGIDAEELNRAYHTKPDTSVDDLECYVDHDEYTPGIYSTHALVHTPPAMRLISFSPLVNYSAHRYTPFHPMSEFTDPTSVSEVGS